MKCAKCKTEVSIADSKCPKCKSDLLQFGATVSYEPPKKDSQRYGQGVKDMVFGGLKEDISDNMAMLDPAERRILQPVENRVKSLFEKHMTDEEIEKVYEKEIIPAVDRLVNDNAKTIEKADAVIRKSLGDSVFQHYKAKGSDVLKILRAGEITHFLIPSGSSDVDLSVKMFPFFKASEISCRIHNENRYDDLKNNRQLKDIAQWIGIIDEEGFVQRDVNTKALAQHIFIDDSWLGKRKKTFFDIMCGIYNKNKYGLNLSGSCRTGIAIFAFGREWTLTIKDNSKSKTFPINNIFLVKGTNDKKVTLRDNLCDLQDLRNKKVHEEIENDQGQVNKSRELSYQCLKVIPDILEI